MAKVLSPLLDKISGKVGDKIYYIQNGKQYVRSAHAKKKAKVSNQLIQSLQTKKQAEIIRAILIEKVKLATTERIETRLNNLIAGSYRNIVKQTSSLNYGIRVILHNFITICFPDFEIDYPNLGVCRGDIPIDSTAKVRTGCGEITFNWNASKKWLSKANKNDRSILVAYCEGKNECIFTNTGARRNSGTATLPVPVFSGQLVHTWLSFISADGKDVADSVYTGCVRVK